MNIHTKFSGELRFRVFSAEQLDSAGNPLETASPKIDTGFNPQLITDAFFESYVGGDTSRYEFFQFMGVGTGAATPVASDTTISQIGSRFVVASSGGSIVGNTIEQSIEYRAGQGQIVGTISEVALFKDSTGGFTNMRSLIKDGGGNPTTLTLTATDFLYVTWRVTSTVDLSDQTGTIVLGGVTYDYVMRPSGWTGGDLGMYGGNSFAASCNSSSSSHAFGFPYVMVGQSQTLGSVTANPDAPHWYSVGEITVGPYTPGSKQRKITYISSITNGNVSGGIGCMRLFSSQGGNGYQISFSAQGTGNKIPKDNTKTMTLGITFSFGR
jgi:hypothetical protein